MSWTKSVSIQAADRPTWELRRAVLVYGSQTIGPGPDRVYATVHEVTHGRRGLELGAGVPATREACADLARALGANAALGGFLPPNLLYLGARTLIWWRPPAPARVFFDTTKTVAGDQASDASGAALIGRQSAVVSHPGLVFAVSGRRWFVYAVRGNERPHPLTQLWRAPYFNVWANGEICTGNVRLPETLSPRALEVYEKAFFDSEFTHPNVRGKNRLIYHASGPYGWWAGMLKRPLEYGFPEQNLVGLQLNLKGLAEKLEKGENVNV